MSGCNKPPPGFKPKDLVGTPWAVAFALRADGWYLRQDIIWAKNNPMPESVTDRCTKSHEYLFLLAKSQRYFYDAAAIKEPHKRDWTNCGGSLSTERHHEAHIGGSNRHLRPFPIPNENGANRRSVWTVATAPFSGAHFATFPPKLIEPCILAGCPASGTVLDPFMGAATTAIVAYKHGRKFLGVELSQKYLDEISIPRIEAERRQLKLF